MFRQNKHSFFFFPSPPRNNCFSRAFVTAAFWISFCCNFTGVLSQYRERVSNANQRLCSVCTHTLCRDTDAAPRTTSQEIPVPCSAGWPGLKPFAHLAQHLQSLHSLCTGLAQPVHGVCMAFAHPACSHRALQTPAPQQSVTPRSPNPAGAGGRGRASKRKASLTVILLSVPYSIQPDALQILKVIFKNCLTRPSSP